MTRRGQWLARLAWGAAALTSLLLAIGVALPGSLAQGWLVMIATSFAGVGALIASRRPENPTGWLFLGFGAVAAVVFLAHQYAYYTLVSHPGSLPAGDVAAMIAAHHWHAGFGLFVFSFLVFPDGRLLSPHWRWVARATVVTYGGLALSGIFDTKFQEDADVPFPVKPLFGGVIADVATPVFGTLILVNLLLLLVAAASLLLRLRRSHGEARLQVKWFVYGVAFVMVAIPLSILGLGEAYGVVLLPLVPASAAVAILKYRLYDIDVVINRTLVYGALTGLLGGAYLASVLLLQLVVSPSSNLAIAGSTLAVAALFRPARARIQEAVDRRFYRRKYDAHRTLDAFSARVRDEVALDALSAELRGVVAQTLQPAHVSLWLRTPEGRP
jgi:hypothetical protein